MKNLTQDEIKLATEQTISSLRMELARQKIQVSIHRDVLNSPAEQLTKMETDAVKLGQAIDYLEKQLESLVKK